MTILIECEERNIDVVGKFENEDSAYDEMELRLAKVMGLDAIPYEWDDEMQGLFRYDDYDIKPDNAWVNDVFGNNYDWKIVTL